MKQRVLVVEDDPVLARVLLDNLAYEGFTVQCVADGRLAMSAALEFGPDLVLLDVNLPGKTGYELCAAWRASRVPIILLTARGQKADRIRGLQLGADDYVTKPFDLEELLARVRAVLRRARPVDARLVLGSVTIDFVALKAHRDGHEIDLTHREFEILQRLAEHPNSIVSRDDLLRAIWGYADDAITRAVDHAIARLRKKIEVTPHNPRFIHTVHGKGYYLSLPQAAASRPVDDV
ncbi:MAG: response regulator transcription factor [Acidobacteria bacterium]|nr:response regulator transcription factor [Acidobacteriota bacterium]